MESWKYVSEEKGYVPNDTLGRIKDSFFDRELKTPCNFSNDMLVLGHQNVENPGFEELGIPGMLGKKLCHDPNTNPNPIITVHSRKVNSDSQFRLINPVMVSPNAFSSTQNLNSSISTSMADSNGRNSLIDLKLGGFTDHGDALGPKFSKGVANSPSSATPPKRVRASALHSQTAYCQVYGCNKDLSGCKDYHKRHRVCEVHSKTAKVIVNGIEQRFCQQCSRFHLLAEFDDGKRSCRKRLAGHNERRRKPQMGIQSGKSGRLFQPYSDSRFQGTMLTSTSFICQEILPNGIFSSEKYEISDWWKPVKPEDGTVFRPLPSIPVTSGHPSYGEKQFPFFYESGATSAATGSIFCENNSSQYPHTLGGANSGSQSLFQDTSLGSEDFSNVFDTASNVQGLSGISDSGCALSLLSSQSQNSSSQSSGIPMARPLVIPSSSRSHYNMSQVSENMMGMSSQASSGVSDRFPSELNPANGSHHLSPVLLPDHNEIVNFEMADGIFQGSDFVNVKDRLSCEDGLTINLLQLSSQLQQVEHQRQSLQMKQDNDSSCSLHII